MLNYGKRNMTSKSSKRLLIAAGDSWTNDKEDCYRDAGMTEVWPDYVAKFLDFDVLNVAQGGAGNQYICDKAIDAIENNSDRELVVMVGWSQSHRIVPYEMNNGQLTHTLLMPEAEPPMGKYKKQAEIAIQELAKCHIDFNGMMIDGTMPKEEFYLQVGNQSMRAIYLLNDYCERRNIPLIQGRALDTLSGIEWILKPEMNPYERQIVYESCKQSVYYNKIKKYKNLIGDPDFFKQKSSWFSVYAQYYINQEEKHPNAQGMQLIAHSFVNKYLEMYGETTEEEPAYVYD